MNLLSALITPFGMDGRLDHKTLENHVKWQLESGITGFFLLGPIGEGASLSEEEWEAVLDIVASQAKDKVLLVEISSPSKIVLERRIRKAEEIGVAGISALPPLWFGYSAPVTANYFKYLVEATSLPVYLHNMPRITGFSVDEAMLQHIITETKGRLSGMVECSGDWHLYKVARDLLTSGTIYYGRIEGMERAIAEGASGVVVATANLCPKAHHLLCKLKADNTKVAAGELGEMLLELSRGIHVGQPVAAAVKAVLNKLGRATYSTVFLFYALLVPNGKNGLPE